MKLSSHNSRWAWLPPIRTNSGIKRFEDADGAVMVAVGESLDTPTEADRGGTRGELAAGRTGFHLRQPCLQAFAINGGSHQCIMHVAEVGAGLREESIAIGGDLAPIRLQPGGAGERQPPEQRSVVREHVQGRVGQASGPDLPLENIKRCVGIAGFDRRQRDVPAQMSVQEARLFMRLQPGGQEFAAGFRLARSNSAWESPCAALALAGRSGKARSVRVRPMPALPASVCDQPR